jgi:hypothetical protein
MPILCRLRFHRRVVYSGHRKRPGPRRLAQGERWEELERVCQLCGTRWWERRNAT